MQKLVVYLAFFFIFPSYLFADPIPDIKANASDGPVTIAPGDTLSVRINLDSRDLLGEDADWWILAKSPSSEWSHYNKTLGWQPGRSFVHQGALSDVGPLEVLNISSLPNGKHTFYFGVDMIMDGFLTKGDSYYDSVEVNVTNLLVGETSNLSTEGSMNATVWKAFRWRATGHGTANCIKLDVVRMVRNQTSKDLAYAVYEDNNGEVGNLKVSGNRFNYNWETIGSGIHSFSLNTVHTTRNIESGQWYWIALTTQTGLDLWFERASNSSALKRGTSFSSYTTIPAGSSFNTVYDNNHYGWSIWE